MKKIVVFFFVLTNLLAANSVAARDWNEALRDQQAQCGHLMTHDSDGLLLDHIRDCCLLFRESGKCQLLDRGSFERW
jgi:hypothetical protein